MLVLSEENSKLAGTKYTLPPKLFGYYKNIILKYPEYSSNGGYRIAKNIIEGNGVVTFEWFDNMRKFFNRHEDDKDIDFILGGSWDVKKYVGFMVKKLRISTEKTRKKHENSPTKPTTSSSAITGNRGDKQSKSLSIMNSIMPSIGSLIPKLESKTYVFTEEQINEIKNKI